MPIRIAICDDSKEDIALLSKALYEYDKSFDIISYTNGEMLIEEFLESKKLYRHPFFRHLYAGN